MSECIPELIEVWKIAQAIGWPTEKTRRFLRGEDMAITVGNGRAYVLRGAFEATMPTIYRIFVSKYLAGQISSKHRRGPRKAHKEQQGA